MMFALAIVSSLFISALAAVVVDIAYQSITERRWPAELPRGALAVSMLAVVIGAAMGSALG